MAGIGDQVKKTFLKTLAAIGTSASNMASNAHTKLNEINLETRRRELFAEVPNCVMELWQKGVELPEPLGKMMQELGEIDEQLTVLRAQRYANVEEAQKPDEATEAEAATAEEAAPEDVAAETDAPDAEEAADAEDTPDAEDAGEVEAEDADGAFEEADDEPSEEPIDSEEAFESETMYAEDDEAEDAPESESKQPAEGEAPLNDTPVVEDPIDEGETGDNA